LGAMRKSAEGHSAAVVRQTERGQALVELPLALVLLVLLMMGIIEFGRAWMVISMLTHAARDGARAAAVLSQTNRGSCGSISSSYGPIAGAAGTGLVKTEIGNVIDTTALTVSISQTPAPGSAPCAAPATVPMVTVTISGSVPYVFNLVGSSFSLNRSVTFRDEGR